MPRGSSFSESLDLTTPDVLAASGTQRGSAPPVRLGPLVFSEVKDARMIVKSTVPTTQLDVLHPYLPALNLPVFLPVTVSFL